MLGSACANMDDTQRGCARNRLKRADDDTPDQIGRYEIVSLIGIGGYARVYKARLRGPMGFAKLVALKVTAAPDADNDKQVKALINEARICGRLQHPNVIEIYEFGRWKDQYFIAMEFIDGVPLDRVLEHATDASAPLPTGFAVDVLEQVCRGLRYAHNLVDEDGTSHQVIHRDLKPGNLMLTSANMVKIMDFGIAKSALSLTQTMEGFTKGTPMYMSPEQVHGLPLTPASDIFTLGIVLFEMLSSRRLFAARNLMDVIEKIAHADVAGDLEKHESAIGPLMATIERMLARDPGDRFCTASELLEALREVRPNTRPGPTVAAMVDEIRDPTLHSLDSLVPATPRPHRTQPPTEDAWSVVLPAIGADASGDALSSLSGDELISVSLELANLPPLKGADED